MVAKISLGNSLYGAICYNGEKINKEKGRLLDTNKIYNDGSGTVNIHRIYEDFMRWMPSHTKTEKPMMHISLNPHPDDRLSDTDYTALAHEYMQKMGLGDMPYLIFKHMDIDRHHIHIVALRVGTDGKAVSDRNNFYRSKEITRELERKYNLHTTERQRITPDMPIRKIDPSGDIKRQVANTVKMVGMRYKFQTIGEYNAILGLYNIRCEQTDGRVNGREYHGLVYFATDDNGNTIASPFKASRLGKFASRTAIDGRQFSANALEQWFTAGERPSVVPVQPDTRQEQPQPDTQQSGSGNSQSNATGQQTAGGAGTSGTSQGQQHGQGQSQQQFRQGNSSLYEDMPSIPGLDLFHTGPGFDAEEEAFYRAMQRRKKKKRRGPKL